MRELSNRLGFSLDIELVPWPRVLIYVQNGYADAGMPLFVTQERKEYSLYTEVPVHESLMVAYTRVNTTLAYHGLSDFFGKSVGIQRGYSISPEFDSAVKDGKIELFELDAVESLIQMALLGRLDYIVDKQLTLGYHLKKTGANLKAVGNVSQAQNAYLVISKATKLKNPNILFNEVNMTLKKMKQEGVIYEITKRYID